MSRDFRTTLLRWAGAIAVSLICFIIIKEPGIKGISLLFGPAIVFGFHYAPHYALSFAGGAYRFAIYVLIWIPTDFLGRLFQIILAGAFALAVGIIVLAACGVLSIVQGVFEIINNTTGNDLDIFKSKAFTVLEKVSDKVPQGKKKASQSRSSEKPKTSKGTSSQTHATERTQAEKPAPARRVLSARYDAEYGTICVDDGRVFAVDIDSETIYDENDEPVEYDPETNVMTTKAHERIHLNIPS